MLWFFAGRSTGTGLLLSKRRGSFSLGQIRSFRCPVPGGGAAVFE